MDSATTWRERQEKAHVVPRDERRDAAGADSGIRIADLSWPLAALFLCAVLLAIPVLIAPMPAMPDYPAHLASFYLLAGGAKSPLVAQFYRVQWAFVPNLAAEATIPLLVPLLGLGGATTLFLGLTVMLWVMGAGAVQWALWRRIGIAPLFASVFVYNANFMWGFLNYCFGIALALCAFAGWIATENRRSASRLAMFSAVMLVIYFCHVFAAAVLLLLVGCYELPGLEWPLSPRRVLRVIGELAILAAPSFLAFVFLKPRSSAGRVGFNLLDTIDDRLSSAVQFCFDRPAWVLLAALVALFVIGVWRRKIVLHPRTKFLLAALLLASAVAPEWAMGGWGVDLRLPAVLGTLAFASAEFHCGRRAAIALAIWAIAIVCWCAAGLAGNWLYYDHRFAEFRAAAQALSRGSKIVTVLDGDAMGLASDQPYWHMAEYEIIDRQAFTPLLFTTKGQHLIRLQPAVAHIAASNAEQGSPPDITELDDLAAGNTNDDPDIRKDFPYLIHFQCNFDAAVVIHLGGRRSPVPDTLALEHAGSFFSLYRVRRDENCATR